MSKLSRTEYESKAVGLFDALSYQVRVALALGGNLVAYALAFGLLHRPLGAGVPALSLLSVTVAGWFLGMWAGILTGLLVFSLNTLLLDLTGGTDWNVIGGAFSSATVVLIGAVIGRLRDLLEERKRFEAQLVQLARCDPLTGLFNRRHFEEALEHQLTQARRYGTQGALLWLDLDHLKEVNDSLGHRVGDELLAHLADLLQERLRESDILARLGGDEFVILMPHTDAEQANTAAIHILEEIHRHTVVIGERLIRITTSIGIARFPEHGTEAEALLTCADRAMYQAKEEGRNRVSAYTLDRD
ncbi:MAG: GGDEF domain-containing protein [Candidatus Bipolaricaulia bacterium]